MDEVKIVIADDHEIVCQGLQSLLSCHSYFKVVGVARDGEEAVKVARKLRPDIVLMDTRMPKINGVVACRKIKIKSPETAVLMLSAFDDDQEVYSSIEAGAAGYLLKDLPPSDLVRAIEAVYEGQSFFHPQVARKVSSGFCKLLKEHRAVEEHLSNLTDREIEILKLIGRGCDNKTIAKKLFISESTVKTHVSHILKKLGKPNRLHALLYTQQIGIT